MLGGWLAWKWLQRLRFQHTADVRFIEAADLSMEMKSAQPPLLLDLRGPARAALEGPVAAATRASLETVMQAAAGWHRQTRIVAFCACPQAATAVAAARLLAMQGYRNVRVLKAGGEWVQSVRAVCVRASMEALQCAPEVAQLREAVSGEALHPIRAQLPLSAWLRLSNSLNECLVEVRRAGSTMRASARCRGAQPSRRKQASAAPSSQMHGALRDSEALP